MVEPPPKPKKTRHLGLKLLAAGVISVAVLVLTTFLWINSVADRKWKELEEQLARLQAEARAREGERPVLRGTPVAGNAWDHYALAMEEIKKIRSTDILFTFALRGPSEERAAVERLLATHGIIFEHLARGAQRTIGSYGYDWSEPARDSEPDAIFTQEVSHFVLSKVRLLFEAKHVHEAITLLLDDLQFLRDVQDNGELRTALVASEHTEFVLDDFYQLLAAGRLSSEEIDRLETALEALDREYPLAMDLLRNYLLQMGYACLNDPDLDFAPHDSPTFDLTWRYGFSKRLQLANLMDFRFQAYERIVAAEKESWTALRETLLEIDAQAKGHPNPLVTGSRRDHRRDLRKLFEARTRLVLLRAAISYRTSGSVPNLRDPFGTDLRHEVSEGKLKIWSVGADGKDDGGDGDWHASPWGDIVLELKMNDE